MKFWDAALDNGPKTTTFSSSCCVKLFTDQTCPVELCDFVILLDCALYDHFLAEHTDLTPLLISFVYVLSKNCSPFS